MYSNREINIAADKQISRCSSIAPLRIALFERTGHELRVSCILDTLKSIQNLSFVRVAFSKSPPWTKRQVNKSYKRYVCFWNASSAAIKALPLVENNRIKLRPQLASSLADKQRVKECQTPASVFKRDGGRECWFTFVINPNCGVRNSAGP